MLWFSNDDRRLVLSLDAPSSLQRRWFTFSADRQGDSAIPYRVGSTNFVKGVLCPRTVKHDRTIPADGNERRWAALHYDNIAFLFHSSQFFRRIRRMQWWENTSDLLVSSTFNGRDLHLYAQGWLQRDRCESLFEVHCMQVIPVQTAEMLYASCIPGINFVFLLSVRQGIDPRYFGDGKFSVRWWKAVRHLWLLLLISKTTFAATEYCLHNGWGIPSTKTLSANSRSVI